MDADKVLKEITLLGKLSEVKITNLPIKPYRTGYPIVIEYDTPDRNFMCIKF